MGYRVTGSSDECSRYPRVLLIGVEGVVEEDGHDFLAGGSHELPNLQ